eukprot:SAG11_NODE_14271_length_619_cov_0.590385_1_plen_64_part_00
MIPFTTDATDPQTKEAEWFTPANEPGTWIPFVCIQLFNSTLYENVDVGLPKLKWSENAFFLDN